ncbi:disease resistance protein RUN1-like [Telopea speciosissima]|uniref:disease resistance protein RUN1-like n=1 Tax=Telopea speciosissima TaxID=54955 RepID=UPI001CC57399|nr:disease resistance protein RUN1-like [Telopea speciosissima]
MGGLGKTTIAKAVYNCIFRSFNGSSFIMDVREEASQGNKGLVSLQKRLLKDILDRDEDISNSSQGSKLLEKRLHREKILLILDDVDNYKQIDALAGGINWFGQGSRVIITTRDDHCLNVHKADKDIKIYKPKELNAENSLQLFSLHAFSMSKPLDDCKELSCEVVQHASGLTLTLEVLGCFLCDKNKDDWKDTLRGLKDILDNKVYGMLIRSYDDEVFARLMISYEKLSDQAKIICLDIACYFIGWEVKETIPLWEACELQPRLAIKELTQKHLPKIDDDGKLRMHDELRFMGRRIVLKDINGDPAKRTRLWSADQISEVLEKGKGTQMVEGILHPYGVEIGDLSFEDFAKMPNLRFLRVDRKIITGDFSHLPSKLRWFSWQYAHLKILPSNFYHEELIHLDLSWSKISVAWKDRPENNIKRFKKLKVLILVGCNQLSDSPDFFSWFPCLQRLDLTFCYTLLKLPDSICQLASLKSLILNDCSLINKLPTSIGNLKHLVELWVRRTNIKEMPDGVGQLEKLEKLEVSYCNNLVRLPTSMGRMRSLTYFDMTYNKIVKLPDDFSKLSSLEVLKMGMSDPNDVLSDDNMRRRRLQPLQISKSSFPCQLQELYLKSYLKLESLPELPSTLTRLEVNNCISLQIISDLSGLKCLKELRLIDCKSLVRLPDLSNLKRLRILSLKGDINLKQEIHGFEGAESLQEFSAHGCNKLTETTRKLYGQGRLLVDNVVQDGQQGSNSSSIVVVAAAADDDDQEEGSSPILCVVFALTSQKLLERGMHFVVEAYIRRGALIGLGFRWKAKILLRN